MKDNIHLRWKGFGRKGCHTQSTVWTKALITQELANRLKQLIQIPKEIGIPDKPAAVVPQQKNSIVLATTTQQVRELDEKAKESKAALEER